MRQDPKPLDQTLTALDRLKQPRGHESHGMQPRSPAPIRKRFGAGAFVASSHITTWTANGLAIFPNSTGAIQTSYASLDIPPQSRIVQIRMRALRQTNVAGNVVQCTLTSQDDSGFATVIGSVLTSTSNASVAVVETANVNPNYLTREAESYYVKLELQASASVVGVSLFWFEVQYLPPTI